MRLIYSLIFLPCCMIPGAELFAMQGDSSCPDTTIMLEYSTPVGCKAADAKQSNTEILYLDADFVASQTRSRPIHGSRKY